MIAGERNIKLVFLRGVSIYINIGKRNLWFFNIICLSTVIIFEIVQAKAISKIFMEKFLLNTSQHLINFESSPFVYIPYFA